MALSVKHSKVSAIPDGADTSVVRPSDWNADHTFAGATSGGIPYFSSASVMGSSAILTASALVLGGGAGSAPSTPLGLGTTTQVLHGNAAGAPTWGAVNLATDVTGTLPIANGANVANHPGYVAANYYTISPATVGTGTTVSNGHIKLFPVIFAATVTISAIAANVTTLAAGGNVQFAVYASDTTTKRPTGTALATTASVPTTATGIVSGALSSNIQMQPGVLYWFAANTDNSTNVFLSPDQRQPQLGWMLGSTTALSTLATSANINWLDVTQAFGTWPSLTSASFAEALSAKVPLMSFLVASVP